MLLPCHLSCVRCLMSGNGEYSSTISLFSIVQSGSLVEKKVFSLTFKQYLSRILYFQYSPLSPQD